jgi:hypothetical protein
LILNEIFPNSGFTAELSPENSDVFSNWYPKVLGVRFNFVISSGSAIDSSSHDITNDLDRTLLKFLRGQSDLIITTGLTARTENLTASKYAPMLILTKSNDELQIPAVTNPTGQSVYITQRLETFYPSDKAIAIGRFQEPIPTFTESFCKANGFVSPVLESGVETAKAFGSSGKLDEVNLTLVNFTDQAAAQEAALSLLEKIVFKNSKLLQILNYENTWLFRFGSYQSID